MQYSEAVAEVLENLGATVVVGDKNTKGLDVIITLKRRTYDLFHHFFLHTIIVENFFSVLLRLSY